ncbi:MAG: 2-oxo acid dehydrogenase subunit E2 [Sporolactobacillus sp.]|jgi:pyruvate dehydrogenase E2 component (dihydrolipoamide acetyltransferase)|nr:2-oxo acid dehydrogenase subunit E2 [Sporolactobacillus sp.]
MATEIIMPKMGMGMEEGTVVEWLKHKGDRVKKGDAVVSISSDKIEKDLEAPADGVLIDIEAKEDDAVPIGHPLGYIGAEGETIEAAATAAPEKPAAASVETEARKPEFRAPQPQSVPQRRLRVSPAARRLAKAESVDLDALKGSGPMGRITKADVAAAVKAREAAPTPAAGKAAALPLAGEAAPTGSQTRLAVTSTGIRPEGRVRKVTGIRKVIARRMFDSLQQTAQLTLQTTADVTELIGFQKKAREVYPITDDVRLTITDFIAKATVNALLAHKQMNSTFENETITTYDAVHLGVAVALEEGLVVPVIGDADKKSLSVISREIHKASKAARTGRLDTLRLSGSTFTVTSLGTYGIGFFTPVLNPPEIGILGVGTIEQRPVYVGDELKKRSLLPLSLTFDHRAIDGAPAAEFLAAVKANLEAPLKLVL